MTVKEAETLTFCLDSPLRGHPLHKALAAHRGIRISTAEIASAGTYRGGASMIVCCGCEHDGPDRSKCGVWFGHPGECGCDCHGATHVVVELNRAEVEEAVADLFESRDIAAGKCIAIVDRLCHRWGITR